LVKNQFATKRIFLIKNNTKQFSEKKPGKKFRAFISIFFSRMPLSKVNIAAQRNHRSALGTSFFKNDRLGVGKPMFLMFQVGAGVYKIS
jgi:hypothetical protein